MKFMVTGGKGFIGQHLIKRLNEMGEVINIDKKIRISGLCNDISGNLENEMKDVDYIFHLAAAIKPRFRSEYYDTNVNGTRRLLEHAVRFNVKKIIFSSSAAVYGNGNGPINHYGFTKKIGEELIKFYDIDSTILRYFNVYGEKGSGLVNILEKHKKENKQPIIFGDGKSIRDYVHVDDVVNANLLSMNQSGTFEVGTSNCYSANELCRMFNLTPIHVESIDEIKISKSNGLKLKGWKPERNLNNYINV